MKCQRLPVLRRTMRKPVSLQYAFDRRNQEYIVKKSWAYLRKPALAEARVATSTVQILPPTVLFLQGSGGDETK